MSTRVAWVVGVILIGLLATAGTLVLTAIESRAPRNPLPFDGEAWRAQKNGTFPEHGPFRYQMRADGCRMTEGRSLLTVLKTLGAPDWIGTLGDIEGAKRPQPPEEGGCVLGHTLDPEGESVLCVSITKNSRVESCFETFWNERLTHHDRPVGNSTTRPEANRSAR